MKEKKITLFKLIKTYGFKDTIEALYFWSEKKETEASRIAGKFLEETLEDFNAKNTNCQKV